jgi:hypothetical protein
MRVLTALLALLLFAACSTSSAWKSIPRPWTSQVIDVQRRIRVVPTSGGSFEVERPLYEPDGRPILAWRGEGPDEVLPDRSLPLAQVTDLLAINEADASLSGNRVAQATLVTVGVILWALLLVAIFT